MHKIAFEAHVGDKIEQVILTHDRWAGGGWVISVDGYYWGKIFFTAFGWQLSAPDNTEITLDDVMILIDMVKDFDTYYDD